MGTVDAGDREGENKGTGGRTLRPDGESVLSTKVVVPVVGVSSVVLASPVSEEKQTRIGLKKCWPRRVVGLAVTVVWVPRSCWLHLQ